MCDLKTIYSILIGANLFIIASVVACGIAIGLNLGIFTAGGAPIAFGIALAAGLAANIALLPVTIMIGNCAASVSGQCRKFAQDAAMFFGVVVGSLATGIAIAYIAALTSPVPIVGGAAMAAYAVFLVMATVYLVKAIDKLRELESCVAEPPPTNSSTVYLTGILALAFTGIGFIFWTFFRNG